MKRDCLKKPMTISQSGKANFPLPITLSKAHSEHSISSQLSPYFRYFACKFEVSHCIYKTLTVVVPHLEKCYPSPHELVEDPPTLFHHSNFYAH